MKTPIMIGAALGALALVALANPASAEDCNSNRAYANANQYQADYVPAAYGDRGFDRRDRRLDRKRKRMVRRIMRRLDYNGDGYLSFREARSSRDMRHKFRRIDRNRDGYISRWELGKHLKKVQRRNQRQRRW